MFLGSRIVSLILCTDPNLDTAPDHVLSLKKQKININHLLVLFCDLSMTFYT
jgi:hypothetical protein